MTHLLHTVETKTQYPLVEHINPERKADVLRPVWADSGCMSTPESTHVYQRKAIEDKNLRSRPTLPMRLHRGKSHGLISTDTEARDDLSALSW